MRLNTSVTAYALVYVATLNTRTRQVERSLEPVGMVGPCSHISDAVMAARALFKFGPTESPDLQSLYAKQQRKIFSLMNSKKYSFIEAWRKIEGKEI